MDGSKLGILTIGSAASDLEKKMEQVILSAVRDHENHINYLTLNSGVNEEDAINAFQKLYEMGARVFIVVHRRALSQISEYAKRFSQDAIFVNPYVSNSKFNNTVYLQPPIADMALALITKLNSSVWKEVVPLVDSCPSCREFYSVFRNYIHYLKLHVKEAVYCDSSSELLNKSLQDVNVTLSGKTGIPLLVISENIHKILQASDQLIDLHKRQWFSPLALFDEDSVLDSNIALRVARQVSLYTAVYAEDTPGERHILQRLSKIPSIRSSPSILYLVRAYEAVRYASDLILGHKLKHNPVVGGKWYGAFLSPTVTSTHGIHLLQKSDWILDNYVTKNHGNSTSLTPWTSSVIQPDDLISLQEKSARINCTEESVMVQTYDPFSYAPVRSNFVPSNFTSVLIIPNKNGYFIRFSCKDAAVEWLCHPSSNHLSCMSAIQQTKRSRREIRYYYQNNRPASNYIYNDVYDRGGEYYYEKDEHPHPPPPPPPPEKMIKDPTRQKIKSVLPNVGSCLGAASGCVVCYHLLSKFDFGITPGACMGPCIVGTLGNCAGLVAKVKADATVICTELFVQGRIDLETYMADAQFGQRLAREMPQVLAGYHILATPLVWLMQRSDLVSDVVAEIALPWAKHIEFLEGYTDNGTWIGSIVLKIGIPLCTAAQGVFDSRVLSTLGVTISSCFLMWTLKRKHLKLSR